jgi:hypothetical protein
MNTDTLTIFEQQALLQFLKDNLNRETISVYSGSTPHSLFLAFLKLQKNIDRLNEGLGYTE